MRTIVVLQRGWVVIGMLNTDNPNLYTLTDASVIRIWGTTKGLGQIAIEGKQPGTILDACGTVQFHPLTSVMMITCNW